LSGGGGASCRTSVLSAGGDGDGDGRGRDVGGQADFMQEPQQREAEAESPPPELLPLAVGSTPPVVKLPAADK
jgi:hypothetical protein